MHFVGSGTAMFAQNSHHWYWRFLRIDNFRGTQGLQIRPYRPTRSTYQAHFWGSWSQLGYKDDQIVKFDPRPKFDPIRDPFLRDLTLLKEPSVIPISKFLQQNVGYHTFPWVDWDWKK